MEDNELALSLKERRLVSYLRNVTYKQKSEQYYNSKVKILNFKVGDLVLRKILSVPTQYPWNTNYLKK